MVLLQPQELRAQKMELEQQVKSASFATGARGIGIEPLGRRGRAQVLAAFSKEVLFKLSWKQELCARFVTAVCLRLEDLNFLQISDYMGKI